MIELERIQGCILDLDGTVYRGQHLIPGAVEAVHGLCAAGIRVCYLTNNASATRSAVAQRLAAMGLPLSGNPVITGTFLLASYLAQCSSDRPVLVIGEKGLLEECSLAGVHYTLAGDIPHFNPVHYGAVAVGCDHTFSYTKLNQAVQVVVQGADLVATDADATYPLEKGVMPGTGAVLAGIERAAGVQAKVAGKPSLYSARIACTQLGLDPDVCLVVGDRLDSDIALGDYLGAAALVLSGVTSAHRAKQAHIDPNYVFPDLPSVVRAILGDAEEAIL